MKNRRDKELEENDRKLLENFEKKLYGRTLTEEEREEYMNDFNRRRIEDIHRTARREKAVFVTVIVLCIGLVIGAVLLALGTF